MTVRHPVDVRCQDGAMGVTVALLVVVLAATVATAGAAVVDLAVGATRARTAADAAALAAAGTSPLVAPDGRANTRAVAAEAAAANGARLTAIGLAGQPLRYAVTVEVVPTTSWVRRAVGTLQARAAAGVRPRRDVSTPAAAGGAGG